MRMSAYDAPSSFALVSAASASALLTASTSAASAASRSRIHGASVTAPTAVEAAFRNSRLIMPPAWIALPRGGRRGRRIGPLVQLDVGTRRISDERERGPRLLVLRVRTIELPAGGLELLRERLEVLHVEADVIEHAPLRRHLRHVVHRARERQVDTGKIRGDVGAALAGNRAEPRRVPRLGFRDLRLGHVEVNVLALNRKLLILVF